MKKVLVGLSGGVDSTISVILLKEQGYSVEGLYMKLHEKEGYHEVHLARAQKAADFVGIPLHVLDLKNRFEDKVFKPFIQTYQDGSTPNPCAICNKTMKFGEMIKYADKIGAEFLATGHYVNCDGEYLISATDESKDQTYFLYNIDKKILPRLLFPLGNKRKDDIKELASSISGLESFASQKESTEICFVDGEYTDFLRLHVDVDIPGDVLNLDGDVVGKHKGYMHYTIGKRRGFSVNGAHEPHYVLSIDAKNNTITVGKKEQLETFDVILKNLNMFDERVEFDATIKLRYRTTPLPCHIKIEDKMAYVKLHKSAFGIASGQAGVIYDKDKLLGGGVIV